MAGYSI